MRPDGTDARDPEWPHWAADQLNRAGWTGLNAPVVRYIADQFIGMGVMRTHRGSPEFQKAFELVSLLVNGVALTDDNVNQDQDLESIAQAIRWEPVLPGHLLERGSIVRVRADAYSEESGEMYHNGREGSVLGVRHGRVVVHYDTDPAGVGSYHDLRLLDKRVG